MFRYMIIACLLIVTPLFSLASDNYPMTTWDVVEHCVPQASPSQNWSFNGTILLSGYGGIHGVQADWETPRIVHFFRTNQYGDYPILGPQLSPDNQWIAVPMGETFTEISFNQYWFARGLQVARTDGSGEVIEFHLADDYTDLFIYFPYAFGHLPVEWYDSESLIFGGVHIYPFENRVESSEIFTGRPTYEESYFSPDMTRLYGTLRYDDTFLDGFIDLEDRSLTQNQPTVENIWWRHDSQVFAAIENSEDWQGLSLFDRDGALIERILEMQTNPSQSFQTVFAHNSFRWSPDQRYFALFMDEPYPEPNRLYIIDWEERIIIDTCLSPTSDIAWSPESTMLAYLQPASENLNVVVFDITTWQTHIVAQHSGISSQYARPSMVGWRSSTHQ